MICIKVDNKLTLICMIDDKPTFIWIICIKIDDKCTLICMICIKIKNKCTLIFIICISKRIQEERNEGTLRSARTAWISEAEYSSIIGNTVGTWSKQRHVYIRKKSDWELVFTIYIFGFSICLEGETWVYIIITPHLGYQYFFTN